MTEAVSEARRMIDAFASVGADSFVVTKTDILQQGKWGKTYFAPSLREKLASMVRTAAIRRPISLEDGQTVMAGDNLIIRPIGTHVAFVQLDDLKTDQLDRVRPAAFIIHATSPGNYQAWIAAAGVPEGKQQFKEFMRRVRKAVGGNDKSASHATRVAGTENFKAKYFPEFPRVTIAETHPGRVMTIAQLDALGLLAPVEAEKTPLVIPLHSRQRPSSGFERSWPDYQRCVSGAPPAKEGEGLIEAWRTSHGA